MSVAVDIVYRCELTELLVDQCAHCRPEPPPDNDPFSDPEVRGPWFVAAYDGSCSECGGWFEAGDQIRADGEGGYVSECCGGV